MNADEVLERWSDIEEESDDSDLTSESKQSESESDGDEDEDPQAWRVATGRLGGCISAEDIFRYKIHDSMLSLQVKYQPHMFPHLLPPLV